MADTKYYPTWKEAWKDARREYPEYESPVAKEKHEKVSAGKRNTKPKKNADSQQDAAD